MKASKNKYEQYLNNIGITEENKYVIAGQYRRSYHRGYRYGTALRRLDPIAFEVGYNEWKLNQ